jgi:nucleoside-diphosphate-sugar epimerase
MRSDCVSVAPMPNVLIAGCGFVGLAAARLFHARGWTVAGCSYSEESAARFIREPFPVRSCDISDPQSLRRHADWRGMDVVVHCASSGRGGADAYRQVYLEGLKNLHGILAPRMLVFTSSTSVYAQADGAWVTEESEAAPDRETGRVLREAEDFLLERGGTVARLAGIYGPGRSVLLRKFFEGEARIEGDGSRWINQAHRDDIASALVRLATDRAAGVFNVSDDQPTTQRSIYEWLANRFGYPIPPSGPIDPDRKRGWTSKRVGNAKLRALGWGPRYPSFFDAVDGDPELLQTRVV